MSRFEIFSGAGRDSVLIGLVVADSRDSAVDALFRHRTDVAADEQPTGGAYVEWAHPQLHHIPASQRHLWRAIPATTGRI